MVKKSSKRCNRAASKTELERSTLEMIKTARRLMAPKRNDPLWAGIYRVTRQRLTQFEKRIYKLKGTSASKAEVLKIAQEVSKLIGNLFKSLIRYKLSFHLRDVSYAFSSMMES